jgi:hypothetical protein
VFRRIRMILPPDSALVLWAVLYLCAAVQDVIWLLQVGRPAPAPGPFFSIMPLGILISYAGYRVISFHPVYQFSYRRWLETTPWTWRTPLPGGPIHLVPEDALLLTLAIAPAWYRGGLTPWTAMSVFLASYAIFLVPSLWSTGASSYGYAAMFGLGLIARFWDSPPARLGSAIGVTLIALLGLRRSLRNYPWASEILEAELRSVAATNADQIMAAQVRAGRRLGWPFDRLGPKVGLSAPTRSFDRILWSLLLGWWAYAATSPDLVFPLRNGILRFVLSGLTMGLAIGRVLIYVAGFAPPITLWGRLATFRPIIPRYDQVFVTPIAVAVISYAAQRELEVLGINPHVGLPIIISLIMMAALLGGPGLESWRLTGHHRVVGNKSANAEFINVG